MVCFGLDRSDAELQAKRIFLPHRELVKQEAKTDGLRPLYFPLYEDVEKYVQALDKRTLSPRQAYVVLKQWKAAHIKTIDVNDSGFNKRQLNKIKCLSAKNNGRPYKEAMKETRDRYFQKAELRNLVRDLEPTG